MKIKSPPIQEKDLFKNLLYTQEQIAKIHSRLSLEYVVGSSRALDVYIQERLALERK